LDGGADGLDFYRLIVGRGKSVLLPGGAIFLEIGHAQAKAVASMAKEAGFAACDTIRDYAGLDRALLLSGGGA
jgi:release factor glutamine methyltransferase